MFWKKHFLYKKYFEKYIKFEKMCFFIVDAGRRTELFLVVDEVGVCCVLKTEMDKKKAKFKSDFGYFLRNH